MAARAFQKRNSFRIKVLNWPTALLCPLNICTKLQQNPICEVRRTVGQFSALILQKFLKAIMVAFIFKPVCIKKEVLPGVRVGLSYSHVRSMLKPLLILKYKKHIKCYVGESLSGPVVKCTLVKESSKMLWMLCWMRNLGAVHNCRHFPLW